MRRAFSTIVLAGLMLLALSAAGTAQSKTCEGVVFPDQVTVDGAGLKLNGLGLRQATFLKINVYVGALYLPSASGDASAILRANAPKRLEMHFLREVGKDDLTNAWDEGFEKNAGGGLAALKARIDAFKAMMAAMKKGETIRLDYRPGGGVRVSVKSAAKGTIAGDDFARALFAIWLGPEPPNAELKAGLLGGACG